MRFRSSTRVSKNCERYDAFVNVYGDRALMAPPKVGFNVLGYILPGAALLVTAVGLAFMLRRWNRRAVAMHAASVTLPIDASPEEIARLNAAIREDS